jgi:hypothetical protein
MILREEQICYLEHLPYMHQSHMPADLEPLAEGQESEHGGRGAWAAGLNFSLYTCTNPKGCNLRQDPNKPGSRVEVGGDGRKRRDGSAALGNIGASLQDEAGAGVGGESEALAWDLGEDDWLAAPINTPMNPSERGGFGGGSYERGCASCARAGGGDVLAEL